jgi:hypothetical protein
MKVEIDQKTIDKLVGKRVAQFNKTIRDLEAKLKRRDNKIHKLQREMEILKGEMMETSEGQAKRIRDIAYALMIEMQNANWVPKPDYSCPHCDDEECYLK